MASGSYVRGSSSSSSSPLAISTRFIRTSELAKSLTLMLEPRRPAMRDLSRSSSDSSMDARMSRMRVPMSLTLIRAPAWAWAMMPREAVRRGSDGLLPLVTTRACRLPAAG